MPDLEQLLTKTKKELRQAPSSATFVAEIPRNKLMYVPQLPSNILFQVYVGNGVFHFL
jgi:hypothetical protein